MTRANDERQNEWIKDLVADQNVLERIGQLNGVAEELPATGPGPALPLRVTPGRCTGTGSRGFSCEQRVILPVVTSI